MKTKMDVIYEYGFYTKDTHQLISSRSLDKYLCSFTHQKYHSKQYSSLFESIIWYGISIYIDAQKEGIFSITEELLQKHNPFENTIHQNDDEKIYLFMKEIFVDKYDFVVKICDK
jgi:hypothetical protein